MTHVADEVLGKIARQQNDLFRRVKEGTLDSEDVSRCLQDLIEGKDTGYRYIVDFQKYVNYEEWKLVKDTRETTFLPSQLEIIPLWKEGEECALGSFGDKVFARAEEASACLGQRQAEYLLKHQESIPQEWRRHPLFFPGAVWYKTLKDSSHLQVRGVPMLFWGADCWHLRFSWIDYEDDSGKLSRARLLRPRE